MEFSDIAPIMGQLWSPIAAVSSHWDGQDNAQICVSIGGASIVPERPRVLVQIYKTNHSHDMITRSGTFALNFPRAGQLNWIPNFGMRSGREDNKMAGVEYSAGRTGSPLFTDCWGWLDCVVVNAMDGGDLTCFLADVVDGRTVGPGQPMWWREARQRIPEDWLKAYTEKQSREVAFSRAHMDGIDLSPWSGPSRQ